MNPTLQAKVVGQHSLVTVQQIGQKFTMFWTFQNVGETAWPMDVLFLRANGDEIESSPWTADRIVAANATVTVGVEFTAPPKPGRYFACFRLIQGDNNTFGDKVYLNLTVEDKEANVDLGALVIADKPAEEANAEPQKIAAVQEKDDLLCRSQKMIDNVDKFAEGEDLDSSIVIESSKEGTVEAADKEDVGLLLASSGSALVEPEEIKGKGLIDEKDKAGSSLAESLKIGESTSPSALLQGTVGENPKAENTDNDSELAKILQSEFNSADARKISKPQEERPVVVSPDPELKQSVQGAVDVQKVAYVEKLNTAHYNKDYKDNLHNLMSMGFLDFTKNLALLAQHHNNLEPVLGKLIDGN